MRLNKITCELFITVILWVVILFSLLLFVGCKQVEYVMVPEVHEIHHHHTDSVSQIDSIYCEKETVVMQLDSEAMAQYGIQLKAAERAWLVRTAELERQLQQLREHHTDTVHEIDSIPTPYPVTEYIEKELTWWQKTQMKAGMVLMAAIGIISIIGLMRFLKKINII